MLILITANIIFKIIVNIVYINVVLWVAWV